MTRKATHNIVLAIVGLTVVNSTLVIIFSFCAKVRQTYFKCPTIANTQTVSGNCTTTSQQTMKEEINYIDINRKMWELTADIYKADGFQNALLRVQKADFSTFDEVEEKIFTTKIQVTDKRVIQIGCNNGIETINLKKKGAKYCLGVDVSEKFISQANELAKTSGYSVDFIATDIYNLRSENFGKYDLVYITVGVLGWMPDIIKFFQIVNNLLAPNGQVFIYEQHPILGMFNPEPPHKIDSSYFQKTPFKDEIVPEYIDKTGQVKATSYWFPYTIGDILSACISEGQLKISHFEEYANDVSDTYKKLENETAQFPLSFTLIVEKIGQT
jgi:2-polyprenyl-3-methyl-5-hydroxy-6-metoxy-1,4-benzoquinol methylase